MKKSECLCMLCLRSSQNVYGSPSYPLRQEHTAMWLSTEHSAFTPQVNVEQGLIHFSKTQAMLLGHSGFARHSGSIAMES